MSLKKITQPLFIIFFSIMAISLTGCEKFLDSKPNAKSVVPKKLSDLRAMLDNVGHINIYTINAYIELYSDYLKVDKEDLDKRSTLNKDQYTFGQEYANYIDGVWAAGYRPVYLANTVLELLPQVKNDNPVEADRIKGTAHFLRGNYFFHHAKVFSPIYIKGNEVANKKPSIALRMVSDVNAISSRATTGEVYDQIIKDLKEAARLLPNKEQYITRPDKAIAYGVLSRVYLIMQEFELAGKYADSALRINSTLMNYNDLDTTSTKPTPSMNPELLFFATTNMLDFLNYPPYGGYIDPTLVTTYEINDLRRSVYFQYNEKGRPQFKGSYGESSYDIIADPCVDELYLTRAESFARSGKTEEALKDLNTLLITRWKTGTFIPFTAANAQEALDHIIKERKKSLIYRGIRVMDQRRLNLEPRYASDVVRELGTGSQKETYILKANDPRYVFLLPHEVVRITGMPQTER